MPDLAPGLADTRSTSVTLPAVAAGTYFIIAKADDGNVVLESRETNNTLSRSIAIGGDLTMTSFTAPAVGGAGASLVVSDSTTNQGGGLVGPTTTKVYLSTNNVFDASDVLLGSRALAALDAGAVSSGSTTVTIPPSIVVGTYYLIAIADADGVVAETQEGNNTASRLVQVGSDLLVSAMTVPAKGAGGATIIVSDTTTNAGGGTTTASVTRFYLSANTTLEPSDTLLIGVHAVPDLGPGLADTRLTSVALPAVAAGTYYIIAKADDGNVVLESKETNNTLSRSIAIGGDLTVTSFTAPAVGGAGASLTVSDSTTNQGGGSVGPTTTKVYLSTNNVFDASDLLLGGRALAALDPGIVSSGPTTVTIPSSVVAGAYYLIARADADGVAAETLESNNTAVRLVQVGSDLVVSAITAPAKAAAGSSIVVGDTTTNQGGGEVPASVTGFYLAASSTPGAGDVLLDESRAVPPLAPGTSSAGSTSVTIPPGTGAGTFYILAKADAGTAVSETVETNNTRSRSISIGPDLAVSSFTLSAYNVVAGAAVIVGDTAVNQGADVAGPSTTRFYLSTNSVLDANDLVLSPGRDVAQLAGGASSSGSTSITIPFSTAPGTYFLFAKTDADGSVAESVETNNLSPVRSILVSAAP